MTITLQANAADDGDNVIGGADSGEPESRPKRIPLRIKLGLIGTAGLLNVIGTMVLLYPHLQHGKAGAMAPTVTASTTPLAVQSRGQATAGEQEAAARDVLTQLNGYGPAGSLPPIESQELKAIQARLKLAEHGGDQTARYLLGLLDYSVGQTAGDQNLQSEGERRIHAAADAGHYLAQFDSAILLKKPYPLGDDQYRAAREAAGKGFLPATIDVARYLSMLGKDAEALPLLLAVEKWDGAAMSAADNDLYKFRMALSGPTTAASLKFYSGVGKYLLAMLLVEGKVVQSDLGRARNLLLASSHAGVAAAVVAHAKMLLSGQGGAAAPRLAMDELTNLLQDPGTGANCAAMFEECSQSHRDAASFLLALNHFAATPGFEKVNNAPALLQRLADKGDKDAKSLLGWVLTEGVETQADPKKGVALLADAAEAGVVDAKYWLGRAYLNGKGVKRDKDKAMALLGDAAAAGHQEAGAALAAMNK